ncbi:uncharacterized protein LOC134251850 [Saccostrea cucullata]|uniref:uncharacterized protein LOC134251850 n=1 Tax=Saccostrea cuccullata TaxID=36930 RepID=UPI002ED5755E
MPAQGEISVGDDIERIRLIRNNLYSHASTTCISEKEFNECWTVIQSLCERMENHLHKNYIQRLQNAQTYSPDEELESEWMEKMKESVMTAVAASIEGLEYGSIIATATVDVTLKDSAKKEVTNFFLGITNYLLNRIVDHIDEPSIDEELNIIYDKIVESLKDKSKDMSMDFLKLIFDKLLSKIKKYTDQREREINILNKFTEFIRYIKREYAAKISSNIGSLVLKLKFSTDKGFELYNKDLERGAIGKQILDLLLYPSYLACFDLQSDDLIISLNNQTIYHETGNGHFSGGLKGKTERGTPLVLYKDRRIPLPAEKCTIHPTRDLEIYCDSCSVPICYRCSTSNHSNHQTSDLEIVYNKRLQQCKDQLKNIREEKLNSQKERKEKDEERFHLTKSAMTQRAGEIKEIVNIVLTEKVCDLGEMKDLYLKEKEKEGLKIEDSIVKLKKEMESALTKPSNLLTFHHRLANILKDPGTGHTTVPTFIKDAIDKKMIEKQYGEISRPVKELKSCRHEETMNPGQTFPPLSKAKEAESKRTKSLCDILVAPSIQFEVKEEGKINIRTLAYHLSVLSSGNFWASNSWGDLILFDKEGIVLKKIRNNAVDAIGYHSISMEGKLFFTIAKTKEICQVTSELTTSRVMSCEELEPGAIYSSHINGDILVGMNKNKEFKVTRFSKEGKKLQVIQRDEKGINLYKSIAYITENINGDVCTSDYTARSIVVVRRSGQHRFSYFGHQSQSGFHPNGICTDNLGHILVCNSYCHFFRNYSSVHLLDMTGQFLSLLIPSDQCPRKPRALCVDDQGTIMVGSEESSTVTLYKY